MVLADGAPVDIVDSNSGNMPSTGRAALTGGADDTAVDLNTSSQPMFENLNTDFSKALMPCPDKPMDPRFGPGPSGFLSVFYSLGSDPLQMWAKRVGPPPAPASKPKAATSSGDSSSPSAPQQTSVQEPHVEFVIDDTLNSQVLELLSTNLPSTFITTPSLATRTLGIKLPFLVFLVKNLGKYWSFEVTVLDDLGEKRRFRASNFQVGTCYYDAMAVVAQRKERG
ncbi:hypothetical protein BGZ72_005792 [Mortierella alpina]|nr:hypothetical protein BGZ72_005792 [Mortierella alpina]